MKLSIRDDICSRTLSNVSVKRLTQFGRVTQAPYNTPLLRYSISSALADETPMAIEGPVNPQAAADQVLLGHWSPITAIETEVTVVTEGEITMRRNGEALRRLR